MAANLRGTGRAVMKTCRLPDVREVLFKTGEIDKAEEATPWSSRYLLQDSNITAAHYPRHSIPKAATLGMMDTGYNKPKHLSSQDPDLDSTYEKFSDSN